MTDLFRRTLALGPRARSYRENDLTLPTDQVKCSKIFKTVAVHVPSKLV